MRGATPGSAQVQQSPEQQSPSSPRSDTYADEAEADDAVYASSCLRPPAGAWQRLWWLICLPWCDPHRLTTLRKSLIGQGELNILCMMRKCT